MVEAAIVIALLLAPLMAALVDLGLYLEAGHNLSRATRDGAVQASRYTDPSTAISESLTAADMDPSKATVEFDPASLIPGSEIVVTVTYDTSTLSLFPGFNFMPASVSATARARCE